MTAQLEAADALRRTGKFLEAETAYRAAIAEGAPAGAAYYGLGLVYKASEKPREALLAFQQAAQDANAPMETFVEAGMMAASAGRADIAMKFIEQATFRYPARYEPPFYLGSMLANAGRDSDAVNWLRRALETDGTAHEVRPALIQSLRRQRRIHDAELEAAQWVAASPDDPSAHATLAHMLMERSQLERALLHAQEAEQLAPSSADAALLSARILVLLERIDEARVALGRAKTLAPNRPDVYAHFANLLKIDGDLSEARALLRQALALAPQDVDAFFELAEITKFAAGEPLVDAMEALSTSIKAPSKLHFALGKAYDDLSQPAKAFQHFEQANRREQEGRTYNETATLDTLKRIQTIFSPGFIAAKGGSGYASDLPVFIVGMPRSGSTLVEQILASHPDVAPGGERLLLREAMDSVLAQSAPTAEFPGSLEQLRPDDFALIGSRYVQAITPSAKGRKRVTDKLLTNGLLAGLIHLALPGAKIIHCVRDPLDTCLSCYTKSFGPRVPYSTDLAHLGRYYRAQDALMAHWRSVLPATSYLEVRYEDVVADLETQSRRMIDFIGLDWNDACLDFSKTARAVNTASVAQVREPLYDASVGRWRRYAMQLRPLMAALEDKAV